MSIAYWQRKIELLMWFAYASLYLGRVNLAMALPVMQGDLGWTTAQVGLVGGVFFWVYALGQLVNGHLGDRLPSKGIVLIGLIGTAVINALSGYVSSFTWMVILWAANGYFQSMGWGPIVKMTSNWVPQNERGRVSAFLGTSAVGGFMLSWFLASRLLARYPGSWHMVFWVPSIFLFAVAIIWAAFAKNRPEDVGFSPVNPIKVENQPLELKELKIAWKFLGQPGLILLAIVSAFQGMVKDGINLWAPTLLMQSQDMAISEATSRSLWIPPFGFLGVLAAGWLSQRTGGDDRRIIGGLYSLAAVVAVIGAYIIKVQRYSFTVLTIALCSGLIYGINTLLMTSIPLQFQALGKESTVAGFLDFAAYMGAGLTGVLTGSLLNYWGWPQIMALWGTICALGAVIMLINDFEGVLVASRREGVYRYGSKDKDTDLEHLELQ